MKKYYVSLICLISLPLIAGRKESKPNLRGMSVKNALALVQKSTEPKRQARRLQIISHKVNGQYYACAPGTPRPQTTFSLSELLPEEQQPRLDMACAFKLIAQAFEGTTETPTGRVTPPTEKPSSPTSFTDKL